jgi:CHAT domain-containing protein
LLSGIALAGANRTEAAADDDGILTAAEIAVLDLNAVELAVLSACETALGAETAGEGMLGLQRAFQVGGVQSTIAGLWQVDDHATQVLMERFYRNCSDPTVDKLDALREAQIWMLRHPKDVWMTSTGCTRGDRRLTPPGASVDGRLAPRYWAAFWLSGNISPLSHPVP